jgi:hypothetical protein
MATFQLAICIDNDAFSDNPDKTLADMLHLVARKVYRGDASNYRHPIRDYNGNIVGNFVLSDKNEDVAYLWTE